jgi:hypothetical protein
MEYTSSCASAGGLRQTESLTNKPRLFLTYISISNGGLPVETRETGVPPFTGLFSV